MANQQARAGGEGANGATPAKSEATPVVHTPPPALQSAATASPPPPQQPLQPNFAGGGQREMDLLSQPLVQKGYTESLDGL